MDILNVFSNVFDLLINFCGRFIEAAVSVIDGFVLVPEQLSLFCNYIGLPGLETLVFMCAGGLVVSLLLKLL